MAPARFDEGGWAGDGAGPGDEHGDAADAAAEPPAEPAVPRFEEDGGLRTCHLARRPLASVEVRTGRVALDVGALEGGLELRLAVPFTVEHAEGRVELSPGRPAELGPLLSLVGAEAHRLTLDESGTLELVFTGGHTLRVPRKGFRPGWDLQGAGDLEALRPFFLGM